MVRNGNYCNDEIHTAHIVSGYIVTLAVDSYIWGILLLRRVRIGDRLKFAFFVVAAGTANKRHLDELRNNGGLPEAELTT